MKEIIIKRCNETINEMKNLSPSTIRSIQFHFTFHEKVKHGDDVQIRQKYKDIQFGC